MLITKYDLHIEGFPRCKFAVVADVHDTPPDDIIETVSSMKPDAVLMPGDLFKRTAADHIVQHRSVGSQIVMTIGENIGTALLWIIGKKDYKKQFKRENSKRLVETLSKEFRIVISRGNHDVHLSESDYDILSQENVTFLDNQDTEIPICGKNISFGGLSSAADYKWLEEFAKKSGNKVLLCHHPEYYAHDIRGNAKRDSFPLIVAGHVHGGQWRFGKQPLISPTDGILPKFGYGLWDDKLIVSAGVSNTVGLPRFGNPEEIVEIDVNY